MGNEAEHCLADNFFNPGLLLQSNGERTDQILAGLIQQEAESYDRFLVRTELAYRQKKKKSLN